MNFKEEFSKKVADIETILRKYLPEETGYQKTVLEAMNYSMLAGGKRLRPMLMQETYQLFGGNKGEEIEPFMAAIEMIHTYSLVHDDLPAMDDDEYRRGRKTTHVVFGEAIGILAGDGLLNFAYETACKAYDFELVSSVLAEGDKDLAIKQLDYSNRVMKSLRLLATKPGIYGMLGGQVIDVLATGKSISKEQLDVIYRWKTSALIEVSMMIGAIMAGASEKEAEQVRQIAEAIGLAFQIQDDILDETSTMQVLGKPIHSDEKNEKTTYVTLFGIDRAKSYVRELSQLAIEQYHSLGRVNEYLEALIYYLIDREK